MNTRPADTRDHPRRRTVIRSAIATLFTLTLAATSVGSAQADPAGAQSQLTPIVGQGSGLVIVSPTSALTNAFDARVKVNLHNTTPDTTFTVTRAIDTTADGVCTSTGYITVATLVTSPGGAGAVEFERSSTALTPGSAFDLNLLINGDDGTILQSDCMTIHIK